MALSWTLLPPDLDRPLRSQELSDVHPLLLQLTRSFGSNAVARLLGVTSAAVANWKNRKRRVDGRYARRIVDLHYVFARAFQTFKPDTAMRWLTGNDPFLENQRPVDVLVLQGPARVIEALDAHESGAYA